MRRLDNIDLRLLRVFVALAEAGSFADAQVILNLSQSTLSTHLAALERNMGGQLCERGRAGFRLTPFGQSTYAAAKRLFEDIDAFQNRVGSDRQRLVGRLRVGIIDGVVTNAKLGLQTAFSRYMDYASEVFVDLELGTPLELEQALMDGRRDVIIGPFSQKAPGVAYTPLCREPHALYCGAGHPLFGVKDVRHADIEAALFSVRRYRHLDDLYRVNHPRASGSILHMEAQAMLILSGRFIGYLPRHIGDDWASRGQMKAIKAESYGFESQHFVATRRLKGDAPHVDAFVEELKRQSAETGALEKRAGRKASAPAA
ncbi:LysR family transcriptional regulator [Methylopila sp. 73B]|uniref:LysR family transcriptional regulator n=1 Tax=Methylopila sp. 73B TaxID=1120792 RepID=UPI0003612C3F|nr:LysR family transcriptional regulator [Methylopila sp. 73B]